MKFVYEKKLSTKSRELYMKNKMFLYNILFIYLVSVHIKRAKNIKKSGCASSFAKNE